MKKYFIRVAAIFMLGFTISFGLVAQTTKDGLRIVIIRHGEKPENGDNLTCKGLNRSLQLPAVIVKKFGVPDYVYVPSLGMKERTSHARMFETAAPLAAQYNLAINSGFEVKDSTGITADILNKKGTVLIVWEHKAISGILHSLGINDFRDWKGSDFDSIWIVSFVNGKPVLSKDAEGLNPSDDCPK